MAIMILFTASIYSTSWLVSLVERCSSRDKGMASSAWWSTLRLSGSMIRDCSSLSGEVKAEHQVAESEQTHPVITSTKQLSITSRNHCNLATISGNLQ